jgi:peptidoglycan/LPS O-acetylase OafA/YrhL
MQTSSYLPALTPLRGVAALLVVVFHADLFIGPLADPALTGFVGNGWLWVDFFFVLSGFILMHVYGNYFEKGITRMQYQRYLLARFARVYPLHLFTLAVAVILIAWLRWLATDLMPIMQAMFDYRAIPASLLLVQSMHLFDTPPLNSPSWSLSTEWWVYVLFPLLVRPLLQLRKRGQFIGLLGVGAFYLVIIYYIAPRFGNQIFAQMGIPRGATLDVTADWGYLRCLAGFSLGMLTYRLYLQQWGLGFLKKDWAFVNFLFAILLSMHYSAPELLIVCLFPLLILAAAYNGDRSAKLLSTGLFKRLGDYSFSIYMVHMPVVYLYWAKLLAANPAAFAQIPSRQNPDYLHNWLWCLVLLGVSIGLAALTYHYLEVPARKYLTKKRVPAPVLHASVSL